jgi:DNA polymerase I-like protein with 3'-5' exonuclease and polymerase domains
MESNGIKFNVELCSARLQEVDRNLADVSGRLSTFVTSVDDFDWASGDELSALLFGGYVVREEEYQDGRYKTGAKAGLPKIRKREVKIKLDGYYVPDPRWEVKKTKDKSDYDLENEGKWRVYKSNDDILSLVKDKIGLVELLKEQARLTKLREYYVKLLTLPQQKDWERDMLHGQFNQVVTATGRSSSSDPNLQNFAGDIQDVFVTRY